MLVDLIILSYHKFTEEPDEYPFSRTYEQFTHDLQKKIFDWVTIDDGQKNMVKACDILRDFNIRAKLFVCTGLVGTEGYCDWDELRYLSRFHDIENHSSFHVDHSKLSGDNQMEAIIRAYVDIHSETGRAPRYFVPPYNTFNEETEVICEAAGMKLLKDRVTVKNNSK